MLDALGVELDFRGLLQRIIGSYRFFDAAIAWPSPLDNHHAVIGLLLFANPGQTNHEHELSPPGTWCGLLQPVAGKSPPCHSTHFVSSSSRSWFFSAPFQCGRNPFRPSLFRLPLRARLIWIPAFRSISASTIWFHA